MGIAGDSLEMKNGYFYINGKKNALPERAKLQFYYTYEAKKTISQSTYPKFLIGKQRTGVYKILSEYWNNEKVQKAIKKNGNLSKIGADSLYTEVVGGINSNFARKLKMFSVENKININLTEEEAARLEEYPLAVSVKKINHDIDNAIFPHVEKLGWSQDNFGPIYIPKAGATVKIDLETLPFYKQIIENYENNDLQVVGENIYINGVKSVFYTFKQDYFYLIGDNRHSSLDGRYWGYVPFDHVLGKPVLVWFSWNPNAEGFGAKLKSIRWDRMFTTVHGEGKPFSFRYFVLAFIGMYFVYSIYRKRKVKK
ncbi:MAG: Uncharacterised protein [Polaribacter sejongensis]|nr:MAG: Uncharacterised protein [Polaribacter sejongensis]